MTLSLDDAYRHCVRVTKRSARNFHFSFYTLSRLQYRSMCALYAFMRKTDDIADDESIPIDERKSQLDGWQNSLYAAVEGAGSNEPEIVAIADVAERHMIPLGYLQDVIDGVRLDLNWKPLATFDDLENYCYHVAGAVGLCCISIWGYTDERAIQHAKDCGTAFQLTNILRDIREDAGRNRFYLPQEELKNFQVDADAMASSANSPPKSVAEFLNFQVERSAEFYRRAAPLGDYLTPQGKRIFTTMMQLYGGIFEQIQKNPEVVLRERVRLSTAKKVWLAGRSLLLPGQSLQNWMTEKPSVPANDS